MARPRTTLVTGARSGMGRAVADLLARGGERVIGLDIADAEIVCDLSRATARADAVTQIEALCPDGLDAIIACAGLAIPDGPRMVAVNYFGVVEMIVPLHALLARGQAPRVVAIASSAAILPTDDALVAACLDHDERAAVAIAQDNPRAYASSKLALTRWIRRTAIAQGWADSGILLNGVAPGLVRTAMVAPLLETEEGRARLAAQAPFVTPEPADPADIAPLLAFLAGPDNRYLVGQVPFCDGGKDVLLRGDDVLTPAPGFA